MTKQIRVVEGMVGERRVLYEGTSRREARRVYRAHLRPLSLIRIEENGLPVCPTCFSPLEEGFVDGGGGWHGAAEARLWGALPPQCYAASRCWECEPYGSYPNEYVDDEQLAARRLEKRRRSAAAALQRVADAFNSMLSPRD